MAFLGVLTSPLGKYVMIALTIITYTGFVFHKGAQSVRADHMQAIIKARDNQIETNRQIAIIDATLLQQEREKLADEKTRNDELELALNKAEGVIISLDPTAYRLLKRISDGR